MKATNKQIAANRKNASKSTGPKTPEGKAIASRNSLKHGLLAKEIVITAGEGAESQDQFDSLFANLIEQFDRQGMLEEILVEKIAVAYWRLRRAHRYESGLIRQKLDSVTDSFYDGNTPFVVKARTDDEIDRQIEQEKEEIISWTQDKKELTKMYKDGKSLDEIDETNWEWLVDKYEDIMNDNYHYEEPYPQNCKAIFIRNTGWSTDDIWQAHIELCDDRVNYHRMQILKLEKDKEKNQLKLEVAKKLGSIPQRRDLDRLLKYEGTIEKQFYKAIDQLERLQRRRRGDSVPPPVNVDLNITNDEANITG